MRKDELDQQKIPFLL